MARVLVIGGGPGGMSAALWCRRLQLDVTLLEAAPRLGGQLLHLSQPMTDVPGLPARNGPQLAMRLQRHVAGSGATIRCGERVAALTVSEKMVAAETGGQEHAADYAILALGARPRVLEIPGEDQLDHPAAHRTDKRWHPAFSRQDVAVVGGGDSALTDALSLAEEGARVHLIHRSQGLRARENWVTQARQNTSISMHLGAELTGIEVLAPSPFAAAFLTSSQAAGTGDGLGMTWRTEIAEPPPAAMKAAAAGRYRLHLTGPDTERQLTVSACFIRAGIVPVVGGLKLPESVTRGRGGPIIVDQHHQTPMPRLLAVGDCCTPVLYSSVATAVGQGMKAAKRVLTLADGAASS